MIATLKTGVKKIMRRGVHVYVMSAVIAVTVFLLLIDVYKVYRSDIALIVVSKNESAAAQHQAMVDSIAQMPHMLSFYNRMLADNPDVSDPTKGKSADVRKEFWNNNVAVRTSTDNGSIITLSLYGNKQSDAEKLAEKAAKTLFAFSGRWYNLKDDVQISVMEGPQTTATVRNMPFIVVVSIVIGLVLALIVDAILSLAQSTAMRAHRRSAALRGQIRALRHALKRESAPKISKIEDIYANQRGEEGIKESRPAVEDLLKRVPQDAYPNFPEMPRNHPNVHAEAPSNLPVADDSTFHGAPLQQEEKQSPEEIRENIEEMRDREPSEEELKRRLNQLLRGEK